MGFLYKKEQQIQKDTRTQSILENNNKKDWSATDDSAFRCAFPIQDLSASKLVLYWPQMIESV